VFSTHLLYVLLQPEELPGCTLDYLIPCPPLLSDIANKAFCAPFDNVPLIFLEAACVHFLPLQVSL